MTDILDAIDEYLGAKLRLEKCREQAGYEAGYYCYDDARSVERAKEKFERALTAFIAECVAAQLRPND